MYFTFLISVEKIDVEYKKPGNEFRTFEIIREEDLTAATCERMDTAVRYMREMNTNLSQKIDGLGDRLGNKIDQSRTEITGEIRSMRDDFRTHFDERISKVEFELAEIKARVAALQ
ncbi:acylphosphatase [groundwater metagenome]